MKFLPGPVVELFENGWRWLTDGKSKFYSRSSYMLGQKGAVWMDTTKPADVYNTIPQFKIAVDRKAQMFAGMQFVLKKKSDGTVLEDVDLFKLLDNPNALQSQNEFLRNYKTQEQVYGNQFMYKNKPSQLSKYPAAIQNISAYYIRPFLTGKIFDQLELNAIIEYYEYQIAGDLKRFKTDEILFSRICDLDNPIIGRSPIVALQFPLTNTKLAYEYQNVIMGNRGPLTILSPEISKDSMGPIPMNPEQQKQLSDELTKDYGPQEGKRALKISGTAIKATHLSFPLNEMLLKEQIDANFNTILHALGLNQNLFYSSTYENLRNGIILTYQDTIMPEAEQFCQAFGRFIGVPEDQYLCASFEHLSILKEDDSKGADANAKKIQSVIDLLDANIISREQASVVIASLTGLDLGPVPAAAQA